MPGRNHKSATIVMSSVLALCVMSTARDASALPIELDNDVGVSWADSPCQISEVLCTVDVLVIGAPRLVPNAKAAGNSLTVAVDFVSVALIEPIGDILGPTPLYLNVGDASLNEALLPGTDTPLRLRYDFPATNLSTPAADAVLTLNQFAGFDLLPDGDLVFTVTFNPRLALIDRSANRPEEVVIVTMSGPGGPVTVPEPGSLLLFASALFAAGASRRLQRIPRPSR